MLIVAGDKLLFQRFVQEVPIYFHRFFFFYQKYIYDICIGYVLLFLTVPTDEIDVFSVRTRVQYRCILFRGDHKLVTTAVFARPTKTIGFF